MIARLSLEQYDRMIAHGVFGQQPRQRLEFIRGEIREVELENRWVEVRREPAAGRYCWLRTYSADDEASPLALPEAKLRPAVIFSPDR